MPPKRTSTSAAPAMTQAAIRQLVADSVDAALEAQVATMASTDNPNRNTGQRETPVARKYTYKEFMSCQLEIDIQEKDKNQSQNDKTENENRKSVKEKSSQSQPREVDLERATKTEPKNLNCQKWAHPYPPSGPGTTHLYLITLKP
ncbi:hypothetical protein Tco_1011879 [Tanacetum coccineum]